MPLIRSVIFVPGNRANMLERALAFPADIILVDLEDSVPAGEKAAARQLAAQWIPQLHQAGRRVMARVNSLDTGLTREELAAVISPQLYGVSVGKTNSAFDLRQIEGIIAPLEQAAGLAYGQVKLIPWIESARAVVQVNAIAAALPRTVALAFGAEDYTNDMGIPRTAAGEEVYLPRAGMAIAARAAGIAALDGPYVAFRDPEGLARDAALARQLGYGGKFAIHPAQIDAINAAFSPAPEEVAYARRVVAAWQEAEAAGRGSLALDGKMVDVPVVKRAQNLLALAAEIESQSGAAPQE